MHVLKSQILLTLIVHIMFTKPFRTCLVFLFWSVAGSHRNSTVIGYWQAIEFLSQKVKKYYFFNTLGLGLDLQT